MEMESLMRMKVMGIAIMTVFLIIWITFQSLTLLLSEQVVRLFSPLLERSIVLGDTALADGNNEVGIDEEDVGTSDADYNYLGGLVDFEVSGAQAGASYKIVLPLSSPVPEERGTKEVYRC